MTNNTDVDFASNRTFSERSRNRPAYVVLISSLLRKSPRYLSGAVIAVLLMLIWYTSQSQIIQSNASRGIAPSVARLIAVATEQREQLHRDDVLLDLMLEHPWDRSKPVHARFYYISNGAKVWAFTQYPDPDKYYQLSF